jgi:hypothetical protein
MKQHSTYFCIVMVLSFTLSCSTADDSSPASAVPQTVNREQVSFHQQIDPMLRRSCSASNCHTAATRLATGTTGFDPSLYSNSQLEARIFGEGPCAVLDEPSRLLVQAWLADGSRMN